MYVPDFAESTRHACLLESSHSPRKPGILRFSVYKDEGSEICPRPDLNSGQFYQELSSAVLNTVAVNQDSLIKLNYNVQ